ncbi:Aim45p [Ascoidea rubescens DSM 1968]|uniref:Probable electron transfer flavoprotein subunit alpha n=1 Tax=Ascoidea rubescens DSM 1968 TaxID=1344418 RepID=A0A1D2VRF8_9ASCO|nr:electron transfer flavo protein, alpha subunit [Ascoidea rubescens DSM 1968]ODV64180.1 electron transfer flavo protein, alpha subunit [Ascoidea rubescens DSM 1968]
MFKVSARAFPRRSPIFSSKCFASTLTLIETNGSKISPASLSTLNAASKLNQPITCLVLGSDAKKISESEFKNLELSSSNLKISKILYNENSNFDHLLAENISNILTNLINDSKNDITHFFANSSSIGKNIIPRVAALLDVQPISDIINIKDSKTFIRPIYAGNAIATVESSDKLILSTIRSSAFSQISSDSSINNSIVIEELPINDSDITSNNDNKITWVSESLTKSERPDLSSAKVVVSGGRGLKSKENFDKLIDPLAKALNAAVGASRAAVDAGFVDNSLQVGQTGKVIAPDLYFAIGISGAIQHLAGMKDSKTIVAINKLEDEPIYKIADYGLVGDLFEILPELTEKISALKK